MSKLAEYLNRHVVGNVFDGSAACAAYNSNRSVLEITPQIVAIPENSNDVRKLLRFVQQLAIRDLTLPITVRGSGSDKTGASVGSGMILSTEKLNQIEELDARGRLVRVQPGVTLGQLNEFLRVWGLWLPISYDPNITIGSLIATSPTDDYMSRYGGIYHFTESVEIVIPGGDLLQLSPYRQHTIDKKIASNSAEGVLYRRIEQILDEQADTIMDRSMQDYTAAGYANITHVRENRSTNLLPLMFASQGTLGVITDIILKVELLPPDPRRLLISFHDLSHAQHFLEFASELDPYLLKVFDLRILEAAAALGKRSDLFTRQFGKGILVLLGFDYGRLRSSSRLKRCLEALPENTLYVEEDDGNRDDFYQLTNLLSAYLNQNDGLGQRLPVMDEVFVPKAAFTDFVLGLATLEQTVGLELPIFGSYITSSYTVRPAFDYASFEGRKKLVRFMKLYNDLVISCRGSICGNGPEGRIKALFTTKNLGVGEKQLYTAIKEAFDPKNIMNPGVKLGVEMRDTINHLRTTEKPGVITP